ncbi:MAG: perosamine synthetase [Pirellulaceae bacterium]|jgi:perosamine synthetase
MPINEYRPTRMLPIAFPSITELEIEAVTDAITNGWGPSCYEYIDKFQTEWCRFVGSSYCRATSSCTGALHLGFAAMGIGSGDEVIVPDITWVASVSPICYTGATPVFVDVLPDTWCIDPAAIESAITPRTKAILAVHLYGGLAEMDEILAIGRKHGIPVVEDAAEAIGSTYKGKRAGSNGLWSAFSFHGTKTVTSGEGGMFVSNDAQLTRDVDQLNDHGRSANKTFWADKIGYKYKISNIQAALGFAQTKRVDQLVAKKREIFSWYEQGLANFAGIQLNAQRDYTSNSYWMPTILIDQSFDFVRQEMMDWLRDQNIDSRPFFYPLSSQPMFTRQNENPVSYDIHARGLNLPAGFNLTKREVDYVCCKVREYLEPRG